MTYTRDGYSALLDFSPTTRQVRINRRLDDRFEGVARLVEAPVEDGGLPDVTRFPRALTPDENSLILTGVNFEQDGSAHAELVTDDGVANTEIGWEAVLPGSDGNDLTLTLADTGALSVAVAGDDITVNINAGVTTAAQIVAAVAAHAAAQYLLRGVAVGTGAGTPAALAETSLSGGQGEGTYGVYPATLVSGITRWSNTRIDVDLDLSAFNDGDWAELFVVADGKERPFGLDVTATGSAPVAGRGGIGYLHVNGNTNAAESFDIGAETWTFVAGAPAAQFEVQEGLVAGNQAADRIVAALNDANFGSDLVSAHRVAGTDIIALVPLDAELIAGNYVLDAALTANMTDQDMQSGAADAFEGGYPLTYVVTAADVARWAAAEYVPVACYPFTDQPELISLLFVRPNGAAYDEIGSAFTSRVRFAQSDNDYWVLELLDPAPADFQADDELRMVIGQ